MNREPQSNAPPYAPLRRPASWQGPPDDVSPILREAWDGLARNPILFFPLLFTLVPNFLFYTCLYFTVKNRFGADIASLWNLLRDKGVGRDGGSWQMPDGMNLQGFPDGLAFDDPAFPFHEMLRLAGDIWHAIWPSIAVYALFCATIFFFIQAGWWGLFREAASSGRARIGDFMRGMRVFLRPVFYFYSVRVAPPLAVLFLMSLAVAASSIVPAPAVQLSLMLIFLMLGCGASVVLYGAITLATPFWPVSMLMNGSEWRPAVVENFRALSKGLIPVLVIYLIWFGGVFAASATVSLPVRGAAIFLAPSAAAAIAVIAGFVKAVLQWSLRVYATLAFCIVFRRLEGL